MFFSVARLRLSIASALIVFSSLSRAHQDVLFTSSVSYCAPPEEILVQQLDLIYFKANNSISFNVSAASVLSDVNVTANIYLNIYGMQPVNETIDLCKLFGGIICPLPQYNFTGADSLTLPSSLSITSHLPGIAYVIPDLEAFMQLTLIEVGTNNVKACVQATISNGWSMRQYAVEWATAAIAFLALALALWQSVTTGALALAPIRLLDLLGLYQTIAISGLLGLDYPSAYTAFALNFSWALGLFAQSATSPMQTSINNMRRLTGGNSDDASSAGATQFVNRKLSPYNIPQGGASSTSSLSSISLAKIAAEMPTNVTGSYTLLRSPVENATSLISDGGVAVVTAQSSNVLQAGIPIYVNSIGIATADAFMTIFLVGLIYLAVVLAALALGFALYHGARRTAWGQRNLPKLPGLEAGYLPFAHAWGLRAALVAVIPILVFTFYQWTLKDSWLSDLLSVFTLIAIMAFVLPAFYLTLRPHLPRVLARTANATVPASISLSPLTAPFLSERIYYLIPLLLSVVVKALVTAFGHAHGFAQSIIITVIDGFLLLSLCVLKPHRTRHADVLHGYLAIVRFVCSGLLIAFAESIQLMAIPRTAIGIVVAVIFAIAVIVMFFNILVNMGLWKLVKFVVCCGRRSRRTGDHSLSSNPNDSDSAILEKVNGEHDPEKQGHDANTTPGSSQFHLIRPGNPTPPATDVGSHHTPTSAGSHYPSIVSTNTASTTLGDPLPRRWSFQHSRPPSTSEASPSAGSFASSPPTPVSRLPSQRHSRNPSSSAPAPIEERYSHEQIPV